MILKPPSIGASALNGISYLTFLVLKAGLWTCLGDNFEPEQKNTTDSRKPQARRPAI